MDWENILKIISIVLGCICTTIIPLAIKLASAIKKRKLAQTVAEQEAAANDMLNVLDEFIVAAENLYKGVNDILKQRGESAGAVKKDSVLTKLQAYALQKGYDFDETYWSGVIDERVKVTRQVNSRPQDQAV